MTVNMTQCSCVCVCLCILQSGPWPTLKPSHHSDPLGLQIFSLYMCLYIKRLCYSSSHTINLCLPPHALMRYWVRKDGYNSAHTCIKMWRVQATKGANNWLSHHFLPAQNLFLSFFYTDKLQTVTVCFPLFSPFISHKPPQTLEEYNPPANWMQGLHDLLKHPSDLQTTTK